MACVACAVAAVLPQPAVAAGPEITLSCPSAVRVPQSLDSVPEGGWQSFDRNASALYGFFDVAFSEGPPQERVFLTPSKRERSRTRRVDTYEFAAAGITNVWLSCLYHDTSMALSRRIDGSPAQCRVSYDPKRAFETVLKIECR